MSACDHRMKEFPISEINKEKINSENANNLCAKNTEAARNSLGLNVIMPKDTSTVNYEKLRRVSALMARTQRI